MKLGARSLGALNNSVVLHGTREQKLLQKKHRIIIWLLLLGDRRGRQICLLFISAVSSQFILSFKRIAKDEIPTRAFFYSFPLIPSSVILSKGEEPAYSFIMSSPSYTQTQSIDPRMRIIFNGCGGILPIGNCQDRLARYLARPSSRPMLTSTNTHPPS